MAKVGASANVAVNEPPQVVVIAGPNGAGKTTYAEALLTAMKVPHFVNADRIAQGLSGQRPEAVALSAGRIMLERLRQLGSERESFGFETTLSSRSFALFLRRLAKDGYKVRIFYLMLPSAAESLRRVKLRVKLGGHDIPREVIYRRFGRSAHNLLNLYMPLADSWRISENVWASKPQKPHLVARGSADGPEILDEIKWQHLQRIATND